MKKETLEKGIGMLITVFPDKTFNFDIWWELTYDIDDKIFLIAIKDICSTTRDIYPGTNLIALVREIATSGAYLLSGEAWEEVIGQIGSVGYMGFPIFRDVITEKAVNAIGWQTLCASENISIERAHFLKIYETYIHRAKDNDKKLPEVAKRIEDKSESVNTEGVEKIKELTNNILDKK